MQCCETNVVQATGRAAIAAQRASIAKEMLKNCCFCAHRCEADRRHQPGGRCHAGGETRCFLAQVEVSDELELIPTFAIAFSGCDLRCDFCITGTESWNPWAGEELNIPRISAQAKQALKHGAKTVMILGGEPTIHLHSALAVVAALPDSARLVWKTNAHGSPEARALLDGMFDVWLADFKFGNDTCANDLAKISNYNQVVRENLLWAAEQGELIVRHLLMPGHLDCCWKPVAQWLSENLPGVKINLRAGFWPAWQSSRHAKLCRTVPDAEARAAWRIAADYKLNLVP